jgi:hypothetical protein
MVYSLWPMVFCIHRNICYMYFSNFIRRKKSYLQINLIIKMSEQATNEFARTFLSVIAGMITTIVVGALLFSAIALFFDTSFNNYFFGAAPSDAWKSNLILEIVLFFWLFVSSMAGGFVCALISTNKDIIQVLINSLVSIVLISILSKGEVLRPNQLLPSLLILTGIPLGNLFGGWLGGKLKRNRRSSATI